MQATTEGDGLEWTGEPDAFYQIPFSLWLRADAVRRNLDTPPDETSRWISPDDVPTVVELSSEGVHTFYLEYTNRLNHTSTLFFDSVILDATPPSPSVSLKDWNAETRTLRLNLALEDADSGPADPFSFRLEPSAGWTTRNNPNRILQIELPRTPPLDQIEFLFSDQAGNQTTTAFPLSRLGDIFPPRFSVLLNDGNPYMDAEDSGDPFLEKWAVSCRLSRIDKDLSAYLVDAPGGKTEQFDADGEYLLPLPETPTLERPADGVYSWRFRAVDRDGNTSTVQTASITLDTASPTVEGIDIADFPRPVLPHTTTNAFSFRVRARDNATPLRFRFRAEKSEWSSWSGEIGRWISISNLPDQTEYHLEVEVADALNHTVSESASIRRIHHPVLPLPLAPASLAYCNSTSAIPLTASGFSDPDPDDELAYALWEISSENGEIRTLSSSDTNLLLRAPLIGFGAYFWRVRYVDSDGLSSPWSARRPFAIAGSVSDEDDDGLPDDWEYHHFASFLQTAGSDADSDRFSNFDEWIAGTDPTNPASRFSVTMRGSPSGTVLSWTAVSNRNYAVLWTDDLRRGFRPLNWTLPWPVSTWTDTLHRTSSTAFYRLEVRRPSDTDLDADGLPDLWEWSHFSTLSECDPLADPDADHASNLAEYIAGTDPSDPESRLVLSVSRLPDGRDLLSWTPVLTNRVYSPLYKADLTASWYPLATDLTAPGNTWTNTPSADGGFYSVDVRFAP